MRKHQAHRKREREVKLMPRERACVYLRIEEDDLLVPDAPSRWWDDTRSLGYEVRAPV